MLEIYHVYTFDHNKLNRNVTYALFPLSHSIVVSVNWQYAVGIRPFQFIPMFLVNFTSKNLPGNQEKTNSHERKTN